ncbi:aconitate hydratase AcnA [Inquilinus limosus]|uniref:Aconitate hydratase n=1 Tax=Inquilinus limosus TaxID=171674 RepID=A0A211ZNC2_9PROT|nr:aconitate hydratase AcnA [Inquilinus limosus]OWJ66674.1 aconitate hydratase 1 [Inquilinus limosus]
MTSSTVDLGGQHLRFVDLPRLLGGNLARFPWSMRILIENAVRHAEAPAAGDLAPFLAWLSSRRSTAEIAFRPARLMMHDTTCVPALVDIAAMRDAVAAAGGDPAALNPVLPVDVSVDHSVAVDRSGTGDALAHNMAREIGRNAERYRLMKWATGALRGVTVHPPGTGIMHTMNLEQLATVVAVAQHQGEAWAAPDTLIGTDSHTPMVNGIGVLGWGVGGVEAESVMFGMPLMLRLPDIVGVRLTGKLREGVLSTDLALAVTQRLRRHGLSGEFVEFFGPGIAALSAGDRAVVANMAPEYGASTGYFPIDDRTLRYLAETGRPPALLDRVATLARRQGLWFDPAAAPLYTDVVEVDLDAVATSLAGPKRPQDRLAPAEVPRALAQAQGRLLRPAAGGTAPPDGAVAIAAITSCTNTTDPRLLVAAGLLARKARRLGLRPPPWVKTSLAPGSPAAARYLERAGLAADLEALGFGIVGYGCTTCIGQSGPLEPAMEAAIRGGTAAAAVLSGNRNFPGRIHPLVEAGFLASPPLVVAYALAGDMARDILADPLGHAPDGRPVRLRDLWPGGAEIDAALRGAADPRDFADAFASAHDNGAWEGLDAPATTLFPWDEASNYVRPPPFAAGGQHSRLGRYRARPLLVLGDDITTDHISPAGAIPAGSDAGLHLAGRGEDPRDLNVFAARRGNWEVMRRGLYTNRTVRNLLDPALAPGTTRHLPSGEALPLWRAAERYGAEDVPTVILAGERYGAGSSRDWAAKGAALLGVRAVLATSFERIHRANLAGMGVLPLRLPADRHPDALALAPEDWIEIDALGETLRPHSIVTVRICRTQGQVDTFETVAAIETLVELDTLRAGGIMPLIVAQASAHGNH